MDKPTGAGGMSGVGLGLADYLPFYLIAIANRWTATSSRAYLRQFGIGIVEWRVLSSLSARKIASSLDVAQMVGTDPASVNKAVRNLEKRGLIVPVAGRFAGRTKPYSLTEDGVALHEEMHVIALQREQVLLEPLSEPERAQLLELVAKLHSQLPKLQELASDPKAIELRVGAG